jgi:hypothetical protein
MNSKIAWVRSTLHDRYHCEHVLADEPETLAHEPAGEPGVVQVAEPSHGVTRCPNRALLI